MRKILHNFIHCGILGWCLEITFTALSSFRRREFTLNGKTSVWMFPIYGMAAFLAPVCRLLRNRHFLVRGLSYALLIFTGEFITGSLLMRRELCPWDYGHSKWNVKKSSAWTTFPAGFCRSAFWTAIKRICRFLRLVFPSLSFSFHFYPINFEIFWNIACRMSL